MQRRPPGIERGHAALLTDLYELTMVQAYWREGMDRTATFSLFVRTLPAARSFLLACGLDDALRYLEELAFDGETLDYLASRPAFDRAFVDWLADLRFEGDVHAVPEGTPVFAGEPLLEIEAPLPQAQIAETFVMNRVHLQTLLASKAARVVAAADGRPVIDFGMRRMHGTDAALKAARAFHIAGVAATSNVLAGRIYGVPIAGTMAHSYVQAHDDEAEAFRAFLRLYPESVLLVDTYDTLAGVRKVIDLARALGDDFRARGIRLDSGDLATLAAEARRLLDEARLRDVRIFASGGLDESSVADLVARGAPIDGFGVGTAMGTSRDVPALDIAYKLTEYAGRGRLKLSTGKRLLPGRKQVFRVEEDGRAVRDVIGRADEAGPGRTLLEPVMRRGKRLPVGHVDLEAARERARREIARLPERLRGLDPPEFPYPVEISEALAAHGREVERALGAGRD